MNLRNKDLKTSIGYLRFLQGEILNWTACILPICAGALLTEAQLESIDLSHFPDRALEPMIGGDPTRFNVSKRIEFLKAKERIRYINNASGYLTHLLPDSFYQTLQFSKLSKRGVKALFSLESSITLQQLKLVPPEEIAKGFHLLSPLLIKHLSNEQIKALDYTKMSMSHIRSLFGSRYYHSVSKIQLIPAHMVNAALKIDESLVFFLTATQMQGIDINILSDELIGRLFPGFTTSTLHPGYSHSIEK